MPKQVTPFSVTEVKHKAQFERRSRRFFTADFKLSILEQAKQCAHGKLGSLLRACSRS